VRATDSPVAICRAKNRNADSRFANRSGADLREADLTQADLRLATLIGAILTSANQSIAVLWGTKLYDAPRRSGSTLEDVMVSAIGVAPEFESGRQEIAKVENEFAVYRTYECADCYGMPNLGKKLCAYEAGVAAGALEVKLGRPVRVVEFRCCANGDPFEELEVYVREDQPGAQNYMSERVYRILRFTFRLF